MKRIRVRKLLPLVSLVLFAVVAWFVHREFDQYNLRDVLKSFKQIPGGHIAAASLITAANYLALTGYDFMAIHYIREPVSFLRTAFVSFIACAMNNVGFSIVGGSSIRYRFYSEWGLPVKGITNIIVFFNLTMLLGLSALGGFIFILDPIGIPRWLRLPFDTTLPIGVVLLILLGLYLLLSARRYKLFKLGRWEIPVPPMYYTSLQLSLSILAWTLSSAVLFLLLPSSEQLPFVAFLRVFFFAQVAGMVSQVPAGLGVFESVLLLGLAHTLSPSVVIGALIAYRIIYYLVPLSLSVVLLAAYELLRSTKGFRPRNV